MDMRIPVLVMMMAVAPLVSATGTGPTLPEKSRENPLDTREPRQDVIEEHGDSGQPRPPTLEVPRKMAPTTPPSQDGGSKPHEADDDAAPGR